MKPAKQPGPNFAQLVTGAGKGLLPRMLLRRFSPSRTLVLQEHTVLWESRQTGQCLEGWIRLRSAWRVRIAKPQLGPRKELLRARVGTSAVLVYPRQRLLALASTCLGLVASLRSLARLALSQLPWLQYNAWTVRRDTLAPMMEQ